ncbi:MAG: CTP synthase [Treponemataceae bacterium]|nr:MAG: CTP synthase [Treponemataceae bacterium]
MRTKYVFITGGVCSSLGKGVAAAAIGGLIESAGLKTSFIKCDPYINVDAANMNPYHNGEVYVTEDGAETDLDLGTFARFTSARLTKEHSITTGQIYDTVIRNEREGRYYGRTVQVIPHITDEIKRRIIGAGTRSGADVVVVEVGGTVGDIESIPFVEAVRQLIREMGKQNTLSIHLTLVPIITGGELKTKPTQHAVKKMQESGIQPDILLCRTETLLESDVQKKIALFCNVAPDCVFATPDIQHTIYELPVIFNRQGFDAKIFSRLGFGDKKATVSEWEHFLKNLNAPKAHALVALVGQKSYMADSLKSVREALFHAAVSAHNANIEIRQIDAEELEKGDDSLLDGCSGLLVPDAYGQRGFLGLLKAVRYARENKIPYLGINIGMHLMAIELARNILGWSDADSTEFVRTTAHPLISLPEEQTGFASSFIPNLGSSQIEIKTGTLLHKIYGTDSVIERRRSKYFFDRKYADEIAGAGLVFSGFAPDGQIEAFEWTSSWGVGVQFHPEFISRPLDPHPLFVAFAGEVVRHQCLT